MTSCQPFHDRKTYGVVRIGRRRVYAHRLAFAMGHGVDPAGLVVRHKCDNPPCVNPEHLELGTIGDNMRDKGRTGVHKGVNNPKAKLTEDDVMDIRSLLVLGFGCAEIGRNFNVSDVTIGLIKRNETWSHP